MRTRRFVIATTFAVVFATAAIWAEDRCTTDYNILKAANDDAYNQCMLINGMLGIPWCHEEWALVEAANLASYYWCQFWNN